MKPTIDDTSFGHITIGGECLDHDILIRLSGKVKKRKKKLSKAVYGTSHTVSKAEAKHVYDKGATRLIIGAGQEGMLSLSAEVAEYFRKKKCKVDVQPTPEAIRRWNRVRGATIGLFHVTC